MERWPSRWVARVFGGRSRSADDGVTEARQSGLVFNTVTAESSAVNVQAGRDVHFHASQVRLVRARVESVLGRARLASVLGVVALSFLVTPEPLDDRPIVLPPPTTITAEPTTSIASPVPTPTKTPTPRPVPAPTTTTTTLATSSKQPPAESTEPIVEVSLGRPEDDVNGCASPCHAMFIRMRGFPPNARFNVVPHSSEWDSPFNPGATLDVDADGTKEFHRFALPPNDTKCGSS
ncbi:hypothetical protein [Actinokineospora sp. UTMC 2448]|uniref:hypothetical protein n=1 Tax=Actinokineospora sp. UTMC 2448 TaxID=2268449 RepID=UPI002164B956|nr:hypothetical protein [Actinokineospora sp. UTMC 2448]